MTLAAANVWHRTTDRTPMSDQPFYAPNHKPTPRLAAVQELPHFEVKLVQELIRRLGASRLYVPIAFPDAGGRQGLKEAQRVLDGSASRAVKS
jgi:hypothetical protein